MSEATDEFQHYVPQYHLRRFAVPQRTGDKPCWVSAYDRETGITHTQLGLRSIAGAKNFYTADVPQGHDPNVLEHGLLSQADSSTSQMISRIIKRRSVAPEDYRELTAWFALQHVRTAWFRRHVHHALEEFSRREGALRLAVEGPPRGMTRWQRELFWSHLLDIVRGAASPIDGRNDILSLQLGRVQPIRDELRREWRFVFVSLPYEGFVTSDNPITVRNAFSGGFGPINVVGLDNTIEVWFPVSPRHAILVTRDLSAGPAWVGLDPEDLFRINTGLHDASYRHTVWKPGSVAKQLLRLPSPSTNAA